jgi:DNA repair protein RecN (Recombination protein N)
MLVSLSIKNYALIEDLKVDFQNKFSIITGETGAGKSILLGGLSLVLGKRADASLVSNKEKKCVIEAVFNIENYNLTSFFESEDLDYELLATIRREILPNGKSRAFINDTPTTLTVLSSFSKQLIDIHSQHETLQLSDTNFQFKIIDSLAKNKDDLLKYRRELSTFKKLNTTLDLILSNQQKAKNELDYNRFLFDELENAKLKDNEFQNLEENLEKLSHVEEIKSNLSETIQISEEEQIGLKSLLQIVKSKLENIKTYSVSYEEISSRINSLVIEFNDIIDDAVRENEHLDFNEDEIERINDRLQILYNLKKKHSAVSIEELIKIRNELEININEIENVGQTIKDKEKEIGEVHNKLNKIANSIHKKRVQAISVFEKQLEKNLKNLEMKNTRISIDLNQGNELLSNGKDALEFLISSNKGLSYESLKKAASGGEISRIMLAVKNILSKYTNLPAIVFDEIDTGVSGEVSNKIAAIMQQMSETMQVIAITHLPQIAAKGNNHFKVFKEEIQGKITSNIKLLDENERIVELAEMLGGKDLTDSAIAHAKQLLN